MKLVSDVLLEHEEDILLVCSTPIVLPFSFIKHLYIVLVKDGVVTRYEVFGVGKRGLSEGYVKKNFFEPDEGIRYFFSDNPKKPGKRFEPTVIFFADAGHVTNELIEGLNHQYPYSHRYSYAGPNSNTYVSWILQKMKLEIKLPALAYGKDFPVQ